MTVHDPVFHVGVIAIHPFGLFSATGLVVAYLFAMWRVTRARLQPRYLPGMLIVVGLGALFAARAGYIALHPESRPATLEDALSFWHGGLSLLAGVMGGAVLVAAYLWARREPVWRWVDALAPAVSAGLAIGMLGLPGSGEGWGAPTTGLFYMRVEPSLRPLNLVNYGRFQPIWAYESIMFAALTVVLVVLSRRQSLTGRPPNGSIGLAFLLVSMAGYGALRPITLDSAQPVLVLRVQIVCAGVAAYACALLMMRAWRSHVTGEITREIERIRIAAGRQSSPSG